MSRSKLQVLQVMLRCTTGVLKLSRRACVPSREVVEMVHLCAAPGRGLVIIVFSRRRQGAAQAYRHGKTYQHGTAYQYAKVNPTETWGASSLAWASSMGYEHPGASLPTSQAVESKTVPDVCAGD
jgi:phage tail tape-measure protein